jgi:ABC-type transport system involved in multi-copper enzyme maturation permease subunit
MTTTLAAPTVTSSPVSLRQAIRSERIKFASLRSTLTVLTVSLVAMPVIALIVAYNTRHIGPQIDANDLVASAPLQGYYLGQLLIGALGVLFVTGEYSSGMIRTTLTAVPRRGPVLWAKLMVFVGATLVPLIVMSIVSFVIAEAEISRYRTGWSLSDPGSLRVVIGTGIYLTFVGLIGVAMGWIVRSTPGALVSYLGLVLVLPGIFGSVLGHWGKHVAEVLPSSAGGAFIDILPDGYALRPWPGIIVMAAWVVLLTGIAMVQLRRRDA